MTRRFLILFTMILSCSCNTDIKNTQIEFKNQQIGIPSVHNARQLGGYHIGGKQIKKDLLLRTARLSSLSEDDSLTLADKYRVQCIYDFRGTDESVAFPDIIPGDSRYMNLSISFNSGANSSSVQKPKSEAETIAMLLEHADNPYIQAMCNNMYDKIFFQESSQEVYRNFFADLLAVDPDKGAVLWHCTQGKDRAGCASAMLLAALGADRELIMNDFKLSKEYYDTLIAHVQTQTENQKTVMNTLISANPVIFEKALDKIDAEYGSLRNYLTECIGVTPEMMELLRERYLEN